MCVVAGVVLIAWMAGAVEVAGYTPLMLAVLFFGFVLTLGLGVVGSYIWRAYENTKNRPLTIERTDTALPGRRCVSAYTVHPAGALRVEDVGDGTRIWAFAHVLPGARIGADCNICDGVFIENDVVVGDRVTVKCGVQLWDGVTLERRRLRRAERDVHQRPVPAQQARPGRASPRTVVARRRLDRRERHDPARGHDRARGDGRRGRGRDAYGAAERDRHGQPGPHHRLRRRASGSTRQRRRRGRRRCERSPDRCLRALRLVAS